MFISNWKEIVHVRTYYYHYYAQLFLVYLLSNLGICLQGSNKIKKNNDLKWVKISCGMIYIERTLQNIKFHDGGR